MLPPCFLSLTCFYGLFCLLSVSSSRSFSSLCAELIKKIRAILPCFFDWFQCNSHHFLFLSRSLALSLTPFFTCRNLLSSTLTFSLSSTLVLSLLYFPLLPLTLSSFYPNHETILEQRKKGWSTEPLSVRRFFFFFSFNNHTGCEGWGVLFGRGKRCLLKCFFFFFLMNKQGKNIQKNQTDKRMDFFDRERSGKRIEAAWFKIVFNIWLTLKLQFCQCHQLLTSMLFWNPYD